MKSFQYKLLIFILRRIWQLYLAGAIFGSSFQNLLGKFSNYILHFCFIKFSKIYLLLNIIFDIKIQLFTGENKQERS